MGFGQDAFGIFPFGYGTPLPGTAPSTTVTNARFISVNNGDFLAADDGALEEMPAVRQQVVIAIATRKGSAAGLAWLGMSLSGKIDSSFETRATNAVRLALYHLTDVAKSISLDNVTVEKLSGGRVVLTVSYTDISSGVSESVAIG